MITSQKTNKPIEAVLLIDMLFGGEHYEAGDTIELRPADFKYQHNLGRADYATKENVAAVQARVARQKAAADAARKSQADAALAQFTDVKALRARIAQLEGKEVK